MKRSVFILILLFCFIFNLPGQSQRKEFHKWAEKPSMGWNSYDCFVAAVDDWGTYWPLDDASLNAQKDYLN